MTGELRVVRMILSSSKLLLITAIFYNQTHAKSLCSLHILEDVSQNGISVNVEKICFNELITQLLKLIITAECSNFSRVKENFKRMQTFAQNRQKDLLYKLQKNYNKTE